MTEEHGSELSNAVISAANASGVPTTIKGKVQRAILRLMLGSVSPDRIEGVRANVSTVEGRSRIDAMVAEEIGRQAIADPVFMERAKARFLGDLAQRQENVEAVGRKAAEAAEIDPIRSGADEVGEGEPSQDWMNAFTRAAEDASSDLLRERLAKILAGEARKPGSFSRSTVRLVAELDQEILRHFQLVLQYRVGDSILRQKSWNSGEMFARGILLEDSGLISGSSGLTQSQIPINEQGMGFLAGDKHIVILEGQPQLEKQVGVWLLTRAGREISRLLPETDERLPLRQVVSEFDFAGLSKIYLGTIIKVGGESKASKDELLWTKDQG